MKRVTGLLLVLMLVLTANAFADSAVEWLLTIPTTQSFSEEAIPEEDLNTILAAGLSAASAINQQPWYFVVLENKETANAIMGERKGPAGKANLGDSPVAILVYKDENTKSPDTSLDCGLAIQNMVVAANGLGIATKIVSSPTITLNGENHDAFCEQLNVPVAYKAVAALLLGYPDESVDAKSSASSRNSIEEKVSFIR